MQPHKKWVNDPFFGKILLSKQHCKDSIHLDLFFNLLNFTSFHYFVSQSTIVMHSLSPFGLEHVNYWEFSPWLLFWPCSVFLFFFLSFWYKSRFFLFVHILILLTSRLILQLIVSRSIRPLLFFWPMTFPYTQSLGISPTLKRWIFFSNAKECGIKHFKKEVKCDMTNYF